MERITSRKNPLLEHMRRLNGAAYRRERGEFLCDSPKLVEEALRHGAQVVSLAVSDGMEPPRGLMPDVRCVAVPQDVMASISPMRTPQGMLAVCRTPDTVLPERLTGRRYVVLDGVQDPGNVGTVIRTADAFGCDGVVLLAGCAAPQAVQAPAPQQTAKAAETQSGVTFTDAMGYPVTVQSWNRVVSLYGSFAEAWTLAGGTLTATTEDAIKERGLDLGTDIAVIGTNQDPNTEEILAQNPDFVILNAEVSEQTALHEFLQEAGVPHAYFKTNTFDEYLAMLRTFCDMTGREDLYEQNGLAVQQQISDVLELVQNAKLPAPNVLLLRAYSSGCKAKGSDNMTGAMLKDLGAVNIADADDSLLENLSMENIIADDPEDIFVVTMGASQQKALDWLAENLQANPAWSGLSAVQSGHYYLLDKALFHYKPNARWGESYRTLAALLYPQLADQLEALA